MDKYKLRIIFIKQHINELINLRMKIKIRKATYYVNFPFVLLVRSVQIICADYSNESPTFTIQCRMNAECEAVVVR